jgi:hypothetical protein
MWACSCSGASSAASPPGAGRVRKSIGPRPARLLSNQPVPGELHCRALPATPAASRRISGLCAPGVGPAITPIAKAADLVLVPCRPSVLDLFAINQTVATIKSARVPAGIVLNACPARRGAGEASVTVDARRALADYGLPILAPTIGERVSLRHALSAGLAVTEFDPTGRAAEEIAALAAFVEQRLWPSP